MEITDAIKERKSIRGYKPDPVPRETLQELLQVAAQSPSAMNTQPWRLYVMAGDIVKAVGQANIEALSAGTAPGMEVSMQESYRDEYKRRQVDLAKQLFKLMDIAREDQQGRFEWMQRGFRYFDAPVVVILAYAKVLEPTAPMVHYDLGILAHAICLAAMQYGLGSCIHGQGAMYPQNIRKHIDIPETETIFNCISIGYADPDFAANQVESGRESIANLVKWFGI